MITFNEVDIKCDSNDSLTVHNEDKSVTIFEYCLNLKNDSKIGNFVIARAKYMLIRMQTSTSRMLTATFDLYLLDDPNLSV